jgi:hypothetical protein
LQQPQSQPQSQLHPQAEQDPLQSPLQVQASQHFFWVVVVVFSML